MEIPHIQLLSAAYSGDRHEVERLIDLSADVMAIDDAGSGFNALFLAVQRGHANVLPPLLNVGGRPLLLTTLPNNVSCLYLACQDGRLDIVRLLIASRDRDLIHMAPDRAGEHGCSCLYVACKLGHVEIVEELLQVGGDSLLAMTGKNEFTCLHIACESGHLNIIHALLRFRGPAILHKTTKTLKLSCLHIACEHGRFHVVELLLNVGGDACCTS